MINNMKIRELVQEGINTYKREIIDKEVSASKSDLYSVSKYFSNILKDISDDNKYFWVRDNSDGNSKIRNLCIRYMEKDDNLPTREYNLIYISLEISIKKSNKSSYRGTEYKATEIKLMSIDVLGNKFSLTIGELIEAKKLQREEEVKSKLDKYNDKFYDKMRCDLEDMIKKMKNREELPYSSINSGSVRRDYERDLREYNIYMGGSKNEN